MNISPLGAMTKDTEFGWYRSEPLVVPVLGGKQCRIVVEGYDDDAQKDDFRAAIAHFLAIDASVLKAVEGDVFQYYQDCKDGFDDDEMVEMESPAEVWDHVQLGDEPVVSRRSYGDEGIYISLECNCDWEEEHGLQIVFKNGQKVNKIGPYDGHLTNSDAYADETLEDVVYVRLGQ